MEVRTWFELEDLPFIYTFIELLKPYGSCILLKNSLFSIVIKNNINITPIVSKEEAPTNKG